MLVAHDGGEVVTGHVFPTTFEHTLVLTTLLQWGHDAGVRSHAEGGGAYRVAQTTTVRPPLAVVRANGKIQRLLPF